MLPSSVIIINGIGIFITYLGRVVTSGLDQDGVNEVR